MKNRISLFLAFLITFINVFSSDRFIYGEELVVPNIEAEYAIAIDYDTGKVLYEKNKDSKLYPASTTKLWSCYLVIKHVKDLDAKIYIDYDVPPLISSMGIQKGETYTVRELLQVSLVKSLNDAPYVLGRYISGSEEKFVELMNKEAKRIGCKGTHFNNTNGLPDENHYTTANDMAIMAREVMKSKTMRNIIKMTSTKVAPTELVPEERTYTTTNKLLLDNGSTMTYKGKEIPMKYDIVDGMKTGYTDDAGRCLMSTAQKDGSRVIVGAFKSKGDTVFLDSRKLIDYSFDVSKTVEILNANNFKLTKEVPFSKEKKVEIKAANSYSVTLSKDDKIEDFKTKTILNQNIKLPISKNDKLGKLQILKNNKVIDTVDLLSTKDMTPIINKDLVKSIFIILISLIIFIIVVIVFAKNQKKKKLKKLQKRKTKKKIIVVRKNKK